MVGMIINNEHKLCRAFDRLLKSETETHYNYVHYTRLELRCLPTTSSVPWGSIDPRTYRSPGEHSTTEPRTLTLTLKTMLLMQHHGTSLGHSWTKRCKILYGSKFAMIEILGPRQ